VLQFKTSKIINDMAKVQKILDITKPWLEKVGALR